MDDMSNIADVFELFKQQYSRTESEPRIAILEGIRSAHHGKHVTTVNAHTVDLISFAQAGHATATLIRQDGHYVSERTYSPPSTRMEGGDGHLGEGIQFGLYAYSFQNWEFLVYRADIPSARRRVVNYYVISPKDDIDEEYQSPRADALIKTAGKWSSELHDEIYVFDFGNWSKNRPLWQAVQSASWDDVIIDPAMKDTLIKDVDSFFDSQAIYEEHEVQWKRGIIFHGPPGCGKTISINALMNSLQKRDVASLYVKSFNSQGTLQESVREIFQRARVMAPCVLIFEDLDSLIVDKVRSYFLNEVDGLESNHGILMIGSTNNLDNLSDSIAKRPSRFDRKYHFQLPAERERLLYCEYWCTKLQKNPKLGFTPEMCPVIAQLMDGFSFAYMKELFVQTLLAMVRGQSDDEDEDVIPSSASVHGPTSTSDLTDTAETRTDQRATENIGALTMPVVEIPLNLRDKPFLRTLNRQAKALWRDMDNSQDDISTKPKL